MITYYNRHHALHQGRVEMFRGELVPCFEVPARADQVLLELQRRKLGPVLDPHTFDDAVLARVHNPRYLAFLASVIGVIGVRFQLIPGSPIRSGMTQGCR